MVLYSVFIDEKAIKIFSDKVRNLASRGNCTFIDAILEIASEMGIEPETAAGLLDESLIKNVKSEGISLNILKQKKSGRKKK